MFRNLFCIFLLISAFSSFAKNNDDKNCNDEKNKYKSQCMCDTNINDYFEFEGQMHCLPKCGNNLERFGVGCVASCNGSRDQNGVCQVCPSGYDAINGKCLLPCVNGMERDGEVCIAACLSGEERWDGKCITQCSENEFRNPKGKCRKLKNCKKDEVIFGKRKDDNNLERIYYSENSAERYHQSMEHENKFSEIKCLKSCALGYEMLNNGRCALNCSQGTERVGNHCKNKCPANYKRDDQSGECVFCQN